MSGMQSVTMLIIALTVVILSIYDVWVIHTWGARASISWVMWNWAKEYPTVAFALGYLMGHFFAQMGVQNAIEKDRIQRGQYHERRVQIDGSSPGTAPCSDAGSKAGGTGQAQD